MVFRIPGHAGGTDSRKRLSKMMGRGLEGKTETWESPFEPASNTTDPEGPKFLGELLCSRLLTRYHDTSLGYTDRG